jgi:pimeloyl-ACP methyl ester carboxylesterase
MDTDGRPYCKLAENHPKDLYNDTSRYELCSVPTQMQDIVGFPMMGEDEESFQLAYYSNMGDITALSDAHLAVQKVLIMIHGSARNADDYFCASLSLLDNAENTMESTLIITPIFAAPEDTYLVLDNILVWADQTNETYPLSHSWRYGADALNAPISSYSVLDSMVKYLESATIQFPKLRRIAVAGHSAGGQITHRWSLLSNSPAWTSSSRMNIVSVVADPRSYCYLDERRVLSDGSFDVPSADDQTICPNYNEWQWGLEDGGYVTCPYRDRALQETSAPIMAQRYATRKVTYLSGELDMMPTNDRCETLLFQGKNRQQRAENYVQGLKEYFGRNVHEFHIIGGSPHDHSLMFQSREGKKAIFGEDYLEKS